MKIAVIGSGFIGSHVAEEIPKLLFSQDRSAHIVFFDFDNWEARNAANQNVSAEEAASECPKVETCVRYAEGYPGVTAEGRNVKITAQNIMAELEGFNLIIDCVDNIPTRQLLWGFGLSGRSGPIMHTGISRAGDGIINWTSPVFDTFPFKPNDVAGRNLKNQDVTEPPCEMYKYRAAGQALFGAISKATAFYLGLDPWNMLEGGEDTGLMTCWTSSVGSGGTLLFDDMFLQDDYFPSYVYEPQFEAEEISES